MIWGLGFRGFGILTPGLSLDLFRKTSSVFRFIRFQRGGAGPLTLTKEASASRAIAAWEKVVPAQYLTSYPPLLKLNNPSPLNGLYSPLSI